MIIPRRIVLASQALPAAGAFVSTSTIDLPVGTDKVTFYLTYTRGAVGGRPLMRVIYGNVLQVPGGGELARDTIIDGGAGLVVLSPNADFNFYMPEPIGPDPADGTAITYIVSCRDLAGGVRTAQLQLREFGVIGTPGTVAVTFTGSGP